MSDTPNNNQITESNDETDGRKKFDYKSKYSDEARKEIRVETGFLFLFLFICLITLFFVWAGYIENWLGLSPEQVPVFRKYALFAVSGMLGGITFGMKYFYHVVARGFWHQDRRVWRIMSPFISMVIAVVMGTFVNMDIINGQEITTGSSILFFGFLAGYFADEAVGKMYEVANVLFGKSTSNKS